MRLPLGQWARAYSEGSRSNSSANAIVDRLLNENLGSRSSGKGGPFSSLVAGSARGAGRSKMFDQILGKTVAPPPRTGVYAGRTVAVNSVEDLPRASSQLAQINRINKVREVKNLQRFHERPGKAKLRIKLARKRREFRAGMRMLFHLALQAQKRGL